MIKNVSIIFIILFALCFIQTSFAQKKEKHNVKEKPKAILVDQFSNKLNGEDRSRLMDFFTNEIVQNPANKGIIIFYCGKTCYYGEFEAHVRGIHSKLNFRNFDLNKMLILFGGYKGTGETEFWLVPDNACLPVPKSEVKIEKVKYKGKYHSRIEPYDCCD